MTHDLVKNKTYSHTLVAVYMRNYRKNNPEYSKKQYQKAKDWKRELIHLLGGYVCKKCGYNKNEFALQIDHINGHGSDDVRLFKNRPQMYRYYLKNPIIAKEKLQMLCANCNMIKMHENKEWNIPMTRGKG